MFPLSLPRIFGTIHADSPDTATSVAVSALTTIKSATSVPQSELTRWRRTFDASAQTVVDGKKCVPRSFACLGLCRTELWNSYFVASARRYLNSEQFVNAIAPKSDLSKIGQAQFATLFRVADVNKRGLVSWDDFVVFETILKRPDADYWIAFQYFDVYAESSSTVSPCAMSCEPPTLPFPSSSGGLWLWLFVVAETSLARSRMTSSRTCSTQILGPMLSRSTLIGTLFVV